MSKTEVKSSELEWVQAQDGTKEKVLIESEKGMQMYILKLGPGQQIPHHIHLQDKYNFILKESMSDEKGSYKVGDLVINEKDSSHTVTASSEGCEFLLIWEK